MKSIIASVLFGAVAVYARMLKRQTLAADTGASEVSATQSVSSSSLNEVVASNTGIGGVGLGLGLGTVGGSSVQAVSENQTLESSSYSAVNAVNTAVDCCCYS